MRYIEGVASVQVSSIVRFDSYSCHWEGTSLEILKKGGLHNRSLFPSSLVQKTREKSRPTRSGSGGYGGNAHYYDYMRALEHRTTSIAICCNVIMNILPMKLALYSR